MNKIYRRNFLKQTPTIALGSASILALAADQTDPRTPLSEEDHVGPKVGYDIHVGTLVSMMNWMRGPILREVRGLSVSDLDYLHDENSNSIGAMLLHLAATERFYQIHTFQGRNWGDWDQKDTDEYQVAMSLGNRGRQQIKGNSLDFYLNKLNKVREYSLSELKNRDDAWLLKSDPNWGWGPTNNYCKWFHVVEHESNHNGQIKYIKSRIS